MFDKITHSRIAMVVLRLLVAGLLLLTLPSLLYLLVIWLVGWSVH
jgi:hypothetical protein